VESDGPQPQTTLSVELADGMYQTEAKGASIKDRDASVVGQHVHPLPGNASGPLPCA
jgi:hypothetical protein